MTTPTKPRIMETLKSSKPPKGEGRRIDRLVQLDAMHKLYQSQKNREGLLKLADEYEHVGHYGMPDTAARIRHEAEGL